MVDTTYQPKVYMASGGDELVVASGGKITVEAGGTVVGGAQGAAVADATDAEDVVAQLNALLASLRAAGLIATT